MNRAATPQADTINPAMQSAGAPVPTSDTSIDFATAANGLLDLLGGAEGEWHTIVSSDPSRGFPSHHLESTGGPHRVERLGRYGDAPLMLRPALHVRYVVANERSGASVPLRAGALLAQWSVPTEYVDGTFRRPAAAVTTVREKLARFALEPTLLLQASDGPVRNGHQFQALWRLETSLDLTSLGGAARLSLLLGQLARVLEADELGGADLMDLWVQLPGSRLKVAPYKELAVCLEFDPDRIYPIDALERACQADA